MVRLCGREVLKLQKSSVKRATFVGQGPRGTKGPRRLARARSPVLLPPVLLVFVEGATGIRQKTDQSATGHSNTRL